MNVVLLVLGGLVALVCLLLITALILEAGAARLQPKNPGEKFAYASIFLLALFARILVALFIRAKSGIRWFPRPRERFSSYPVIDHR
jgi:hypothetical protein